MQFRPQISFEQYRAACEALAATKGRPAIKRTWKYYLFLLPCCVIVGFAPQSDSLRAPALLCVGAMVFSLILQPLTKRSQSACYKRVYDEEQAFLNDQILTISESGITCDQGNGKAVVHYTWQAFIKRIDTSEMVLFLPSPNSFVRVSKEAFTPAELEQIAVWSSGIPTA